MTAPSDVAELISATIRESVAGWRGATKYREPLLASAAADDRRFAELKRVVNPRHMLPEDLVPAARSVASFFLPFDEDVVEANAGVQGEVAPEWVLAYLETNVLIEQVTGRLVELLVRHGVRAAAEPPSGRYDRRTFTSTWSHKSVAVIAGLGSFGVHRMAITDSGCAGRFGSLVLDCELPWGGREQTERCLHIASGDCLECVQRCPVGALSDEDGIDKQLCWTRCRRVAETFEGVGAASVCGKCALGPCALRAAA
ncbi:MAG: epoxyqueuosine reductase [Gemmatimonadota bacterium]